MQFHPVAPDLLAGVGDLLDDEVLDAVPPHLKHSVRVAGHLVRLVERELRLGPDAAVAEAEALAGLLGDGAPDDVAALNELLAARIRESGDKDLERRALTALVDVTRADLAVAKPGHDAWEGR